MLSKKVFACLAKIAGKYAKFATANWNILVFLLFAISLVDPCLGMPNLRKGTNATEMCGMRKMDNSIRARQLYRRFSSTMVPIREREKTSLCTYEVITDINHQRIPDKIDRVVCRRDACKCLTQGDFECTQLYSQLNVTYLTPDLKLSFDFELIKVEYACVCSRATAAASINLLEPVIV